VYETVKILEVVNGNPIVLCLHSGSFDGKYFAGSWRHLNSKARGTFNLTAKSTNKDS
jgi:hypothetical protein